jgi:pyruvate kinase
MDRIAREIEHLRRSEAGAAPPEVGGIGTDRELALAGAACRIAETLRAAGIVCFTITGNTARYVSQRRPDVPVYALTPLETTYRRLSLVWAVRSMMLEVVESTDQMVEFAQERLTESGFAAEGDTLVYIAGASPKTPGGTSMLKVQQL